MGEVIRLDERRKVVRLREAAKQRRVEQVDFLFDLASPFTYLAAERVDRAFTTVTWIPASSATLRGGAPHERDELAALRAAAEARAAALRLPLAWPDRWPDEVPEAMRVAAYAAERGRAVAFVLAAARLAFAGGYDLRDPATLADAAAAAGLAPEEAARAAREERRDAAAQMAGRQLLCARAARLPALRVGDDVFAGEARIAEAVATARWRAAVS